MVKALEVVESIAQSEGFDNLYYLDLHSDVNEVRFGRKDNNYTYSLDKADFEVLKVVLDKLEVSYEEY